ncbi:LysR family transcriptional regulator [Haliangium sp.]|uniref:LysR family transcriptional regulator n=1 Tax=Haliangium sp. TaxID=2663208 RepID=UPI003D123551
MSATGSDIRLGGIDLNLLVALHELLETSSVTQAAQRLGITQSAMSHVLRRLRSVFGDKLLVRGQGGMVLTPRAEAIREPLYRSLIGLQDTLVSHERFEPAESERVFRLVVSDYVQLTFLPRLVARVAEEAPGAQIHVEIINDVDGLMDQLLAGEFDMATGGPLVKAPPEVLRDVLLDDRLVCVLRRGHPRVGQHLTLDDYVALPHLLVSPSGQGPGTVDVQLAAMGRARHIAVRVQNFLSAPFLLVDSDLVLTAPERLVAAYAQTLDLDVYEPPLALPPFQIVALWNYRDRDRPAITWLREVIMSVCAEPPPPCPVKPAPRAPVPP